MQTEVWNLPAPKARELQSDQEFGATTLLIDPDYVFVARAHLPGRWQSEIEDVGNERGAATEGTDRPDRRRPVFLHGTSRSSRSRPVHVQPRRTRAPRQQSSRPCTRNPVDDAKLEAVQLLTVANNELQVIVQPAKVGTAGESGAGAQRGARSVITYNPAKKTWPVRSRRTGLRDRSTSPRRVLPTATRPRAVSGRYSFPRPMPKARFPLTLAQPRKRCQAGRQTRGQRVPEATSGIGLARAISSFSSKSIRRRRCGICRTDGECLDEWARADGRHACHCGSMSVPPSPSPCPSRRGLCRSGAVLHRLPLRLDLREAGAALQFRDLVAQQRGLFVFEVRRRRASSPPRVRAASR